jgi:hypothetical protein
MKDETNQLNGRAGKKVATVRNSGVRMVMTHDNDDKRKDEG